MYIEKINIKSFGQLSEREFTLAPGVNIFEGENESGKSTLASFISFVLYGAKDRASGKRYVNWNASSVSGSLLVRAGEKRILIERSAVLSGEAARETWREKVRMTDADTGLELHHGECPGEVLFGVPEDVFSGTSFVRQIGGARIDGARMSAAAENLLFSADEAVNTEQAIKKIDAVRRGLLHKNSKGGAIYEKEMKVQELESRLETAKSASGELINVEAAISDLEAARSAAVKKRDISRERAHNFETVRDLHRFEKLSAVKGEISALENELSALYSDEHFPDDAYIGGLRAISDGMASTAATISSVSEKLDELRAEEESYSDRELYDIFDGAETDEDIADEIAADVNGAFSKKTAATVMACVFLLFAAGCGAASYILRGDRMLMLTLMAAAGVFSLAFLISVLTSLVTGVKCRRIKRFYGIDGTEMLREHLLDIAASAERYRRTEEMIFSAEGEMDVQYAVLDRDRAAARDLLSARGVEVDDDGIPAALAEAISDCESVTSRARAIEAELGRRKIEAEELGRELADTDEEEVRTAALSLDIAAYDSISPAELRRERDFTENAVLRIGESIEEQKIRHARLSERREDPAKLSVRLEATRRELAEDKARYEACVLAMEALEAAGKGVRESVAPRLRELAREYLGRVSEGKYTELGVDGAFGLTISADGEYRELEYMSGGTTDAAYLSLRLALVRLLYRRELPPMIFDESFSQLDDRRAGAMLSVVSGGEAQSLIFTCQKRESRLCEQTGANVNLIRL